MQRLLRRGQRLSSWQLIGWLAIAGGIACSDQALSPAASPRQTSSNPAVTNLIAVNCTANRTSLSVTCSSPGISANVASSDGRRFYLVVGGQGTYIKLTSSAVSYTAVDSIFQFDVTVQNLIPQPMGTTDGTTPDSSGVRVFFSSGPTSGQGIVTVANPDLLTSYTAPNQPTYKYGAAQTGDGILSSGETSSAKTWQLKMPPQVTLFEFTVYVAAEVPGPHGYVDVAPGAGFLYMDSTRTLTAVVRNALGNPIGGTVTWSTGDSTIAHVDASGNVTGGHANAGLVTITATSGTLTGTFALSVCPNVPVGLDINFPAASYICLGGGATGAEYTYMPVNLAGGSPVLNLAVTGTGVIDVTGPPTPNLMTGGPKFSQLGLQLSENAKSRIEIDDSKFIAQDMDRMNQLMGDPRSRVKLNVVPGGMRPRFTVPPPPPAVGDSVSYDTNQVCNAAPQLKRGVVKSVSNHLVIVQDTANPAGGLTTAQYDSIGAEFDSIAFNVDSANFGAPTDIDSNQHIIAFYTRDINHLTPAASTSIVAGLFMSKDVFASPGAGCSNSNQKEIIFMMAPDPSGTINSNVRTASFVRSIAVLTLGHELQHLINGFRRAYVNGSSFFEFAWLNEGLSTVAEELMFYKMSQGKSPRQNISSSDLSGNAARAAAFNTFQLGNFTRLGLWLSRPDTTGPFRSASPNSPAFRGALWGYLRFVADRYSGGNDAALWFALVNSSMQGFGNIQNAIGTDPFNALKEFGPSLYVDDLGYAVPSSISFPSWSLRSVYGGIGGFPLFARQLSSGVPVSLSYQLGGSTSFFRFGVPASGFATITNVGLSPTPTVPSSPFGLIIIRTK